MLTLFQWILGPTEEFEDCEWTDWQDNDDPSATGDWENAPNSCDVQKYQVQLVAGGTVYNNVADIFLNNVQYSNPGGVYCKHDQQPTANPVNSLVLIAHSMI